MISPCGERIACGGTMESSHDEESSRDDRRGVVGPLHSVGAPARERAESYARDLGWHIVPVWGTSTSGSCRCPIASECRRPGKHPITDLVPHGFRDATNDLAVVRGWFDMHPDANIGFVPGTSGIIVLDLDPRNGGLDSWRAAAEGQLPDTVRAVTGGSGKHILFGVAESGFDPAPHPLGPGIDVIFDDGYSVLPPSTHRSGQRYQWVRDPLVHPVASLPGWLANKLRRAEEGRIAPQLDSPNELKLPALGRRLKRARAYLRKLPPSIAGEGGQAALMLAVASVVRGFCIPDPEAFRLLSDEFNPRCRDGRTGGHYPWSESALRTAIENARARSRHSWGNRLVRR